MTRSCTAPPAPGQLVLAAIGNRMEQVGLRLHPAKTRIVYCKDGEGAARTSTRRSRSWGLPSGPAGPRSKNGETFTVVPARGQQGRPEQNERGGTSLAAPPAHRAHHRRARPEDQPDRAGLDAILRCVLPLRAASPPAAHQRLPDALDPQKVQRLRPAKKATRLLGTHHCATPRLFAHWAWGHIPGDQDDKSRVTGDCHARIRGGRGLKSPGYPTLIILAAGQLGYVGDERDNGLQAGMVSFHSASPVLSLRRAAVPARR